MNIFIPVEFNTAVQRCHYSFVKFSDHKGFINAFVSETGKTSFGAFKERRTAIIPIIYNPKPK